MDHTAENIGHISPLLYGAFRTMRLENDVRRKKYRFVVGEPGNEQVLSAAHLTLSHLDWFTLEPFVAQAIEALHRGAVEVAVRVRGVRIVQGRGSPKRW